VLSTENCRAWIWSALAAFALWLGHAPACLAADQGDASTPAASATPADSGSRLDRSAALIKDSFLDIGDDLKGIALYPVDHPKPALYSLLGVAGLVAVDKPVTRYWQDKVEPAFNGYNIKAPKFMTKTGINNAGGVDGWLMLGIGGSWVLGAALDDQRSQLAALLSVKAAAYSVLVSQLVLKSLTGRLRPDPNLSNPTGQQPYTTNPYAFGHFHHPFLGANQYGTAMPSFTFTLYFAVARVYSRVYDNYWIPYGLAAAALTSNIRGHHHWVSDMVAGSLVGTMIGSVVADNALGDDGGKQTDSMVVPIVSPEMTGLAWLRQF
jgi:PAP2 superfamily